MKYINLFKWRAPQSTKYYRDIDYWCWKKLNNLVAAGIYAIVQDNQKNFATSFYLVYAEQ